MTESRSASTERAEDIGIIIGSTIVKIDWYATIPIVNQTPGGHLFERKNRIKQGKTGRRVMVPVGVPLKAALDTTKRVCPRVLVNSDGIPWTPDGFRVSWRKTCIKASVSGVTFRDLRGTAVLNLALAGATEAEIATITGHSLKDVRSTLDASYLSRDNRLAEAGIRKLESVSKLRVTD